MMRASKPSLSARWLVGVNGTIGFAVSAADMDVHGFTGISFVGLEEKAE